MNSALNDDPELQRLMAAQELFENVFKLFLLIQYFFKAILMKSFKDKNIR